MLHVERRTLISVALGRRLVDDAALRAAIRRGHIARDSEGHPQVTAAGVEAALTPRMWDVLDACAHGRVEWIDNGSTGAGAIGGVPAGVQLNQLDRLGLVAVEDRTWGATARGVLLLALRGATDAGST